MYNQGLFCMPEGVDLGEHVIATYFIETKATTDILRLASSIAIEQTTGTWLPVPEETPELRRRHAGKVVAIYEAPFYEFEVPSNIETRKYVVQIAFPEVNFGAQIPMLLSTVIGNISMMGRIKLLDLKFPERFVKDFKGPKFGIQGIRKILDISKRPLLNNMIKPCTGFPAEVGARLFYKVAVGGVDIIKDDELLADPPFCPLEERVRKYMEAADRAYEETSEKTLYTANITDRVDKIIGNAEKAIDAGANALMLNYLTVGISALRSLAEDPSIKVPILAHLDFAGTMYESPFSGMSSTLILGKLPRLAGADVVVYPNPYAKFSFLRERHIQIAQALRNSFYSIDPAFPMPGGGIHPGMVPTIVGDLGSDCVIGAGGAIQNFKRHNPPYIFGSDCVIGAGGAIHGHPMGPTAGAKAFRQAINAIMEGVSLQDAARENTELKSAIDLWGIYKID